MTQYPDEPMLFDFLDVGDPPLPTTGVDTTVPARESQEEEVTTQPVVALPAPHTLVPLPPETGGAAGDEAWEIAARREHLRAQLSARPAHAGIMFIPFEDERLQRAWQPGPAGAPAGCSLCQRRPAEGPHFLRCALCVRAAALELGITPDA